MPLLSLTADTRPFLRGPWTRVCGALRPCCLQFCGHRAGSGSGVKLLEPLCSLALVLEAPAPPDGLQSTGWACGACAELSRGEWGAQSWPPSTSFPVRALPSWYSFSLETRGPPASPQLPSASPQSPPTFPQSPPTFPQPPPASLQLPPSLPQPPQSFHPASSQPPSTLPQSPLSLPSASLSLPQPSSNLHPAYSQPPSPNLS